MIKAKTSRYVVKFHLYKTLFLLFGEMMHLELENRSLRGTSKLRVDKTSDEAYFRLKYLLAHRSHQKKLGLRTYRVLRVILKAMIYSATFNSIEERWEEYQNMLYTTKLWR